MSERRACLPVRSEEAARAERMARYKERRRRQLAEQLDPPAPAPVRTTRTSRLRAAGASSSDSGKESRRADGAGSKDSSSPRSPAGDAPPPASLRLSGGTGAPQARARKVGVVERRGTSATTTTASSSDHEAPNTARTLERREKDKSSKRKSNLNRSLTEEVVVDLADERVARRRRRAEPPELEGGRAAWRREDAAPSAPSAPSSPGAPSSPTKMASSPDNQVKTADCMESSENRVNGFYNEDTVHESIPVKVNGIHTEYDSAFVIQDISGAKSSTRKHVLVEESDLRHHIPQISSLPTSLQRSTSYRMREASRSLSGSPVRHPSSILKKKSLDETQSTSHSPVHLVSILKRKPSRDSSSVSPVTFSPTVVDSVSRRSKQHGILKKRASLDECEVMRRSCSPDLGSEPHDFKPILKHHRRSSLEELVMRTQSPDPQPQSILKRRTSREDILEDCGSTFSEPQGILKRKTASSNSSNCSSASNSPHVSISSSVMLAARIDTTETSDATEQVKPILKKKSSSEDSTSADCSSEVPKPILKKHSFEVEDLDDRPMKPILKTSRKSSREEWDSYLPGSHILLRGRSLGSDSVSGSDCDVKPILKQQSSDAKQQRERSASPRHKLSFSDSRDTQSLDGLDIGGVVKRRPRPRPASIVGVVRSSSSAIDSELSSILSRRRSLEVDNVASQNLEGEVSPEPPLSVRNNSQSPEIADLPSSTSVAERILTMESFLSEESHNGISVIQASRGAVPKTRIFHRIGKSKDRFYTQPVTLEEIKASERFESVQTFQKSVGGTDAPVVREDVSSGAEGAGLQRSDSVVARASLFAQLEEQMKAAADEAKSRRPPRRRDRDPEAAGRYATQPVTCEELHEAARQSASTAAENQGEGRDEEDPSKLTLAERVRLFNQKIKEETLPKAADAPLQRPLARKRVVSSRFKTQPVTTDEVDNAQRISTLAATLTKPPDDELLGSLSAKAVKEKIYEHASKILSKQKFDSSKKTYRIATNGDEKPRGILKNSREVETKTLGQSDIVGDDDSEEEEEEEGEDDNESGNEVKSILKLPSSGSTSPTAELEGFRQLKSVLKKETDKDQNCEVVSTTNEHLRSILKQESKDWSAEDGALPSSAEDGSAPSEEEVSEGKAQAGKTVHLRGGKEIDLVSILHDVEATARQQRQANNCNSADSREKLMNQKNLSHDEETKSVRHSYQKARVAEISSKTISESYSSKKIVSNHQEYKSSVHRKVDARHSEESQSVRKLVESPLGVKVVSGVRQRKSYEHKLHRHLDEVSSQNDTTPPTSDGDTSSSGGREVRQIISSETVSRRRQPPVSKYKARSSAPAQPELSKSRSHSAVATCASRGLQVTSRTCSDRHAELESHGPESLSGFVRDGIRRSFTQPMTHLEHQEAGGDKEMNRTSIADRVAALQKSKEQDWRKRVPKTNADEELICTVNNHINVSSC